MIFQLLSKIVRRARWARLALRGADVTYDIQIHSASLVHGDARQLRCGAGCFFEEGSRLLVGAGDGSAEISPRLRLGSGVYVNRYSILDCAHSMSIGDRVQIGPHCYIGDFDHSLEPGGDSHALGEVGAVVIEDEAWLGAGVIVLKGVRIGARAVVGAGSVVTKDVPAHAVAVGNPVRVIRTRAAASAEENLAL